MLYHKFFFFTASIFIYFFWFGWDYLKTQPDFVIFFGGGGYLGVGFTVRGGETQKIWYLKSSISSHSILPSHGHRRRSGPPPPSAA